MKTLILLLTLLVVGCEKKEVEYREYRGVIQNVWYEERAEGSNWHTAVKLTSGYTEIFRGQYGAVGDTVAIRQMIW